MDAITTPPLTPDIRRLISAFPDITFIDGAEFRWDPTRTTIEYVSDDPHGIERLLHEVAHAHLGHNQFSRDVELITLERDAWHYATATLAPIFHIEINANLIEDDLNTYRDWLHARSTCPTCNATGIQTGASNYTCVACRTTWKVNQAISCGLRRYIQQENAPGI